MPPEEDGAVARLTQEVGDGVLILAVEQTTGNLVPSFRHRASGYDLPGGRRDDKVGLRPNTADSTPWR